MEKQNPQTHPWRCCAQVGLPNGKWTTRARLFASERGARAAMDGTQRPDVRKVYLHTWTDNKWWRYVAVRTV